LKGIVTDIQRYSIHDGPGIRTVVFFKGCPLSCFWCCNPETQSFQPELEFMHRLCQQCGRCVQVCAEKAVNPDLNCPETEKIDRKKCTLCQKCVLACPSGALKIVGKLMTMKEVMEIVLKDVAFYRRSGGGVTLSGGEPLAQPEFAYELLKDCHNHNVNTAMETCGLAPRNIFEKILPYTDLFLYDIKLISTEKHQAMTGVKNEVILSNLRWLRQNQANIILRIPLIPGINMDLSDYVALSDLVSELEITEVNLMPFHQLGKDKYSHLGRAYPLKNQTDLRLNETARQRMFEIQEMLQSRHIKVLIGG